jgi:hypothetical protein
MPPEVKLVQPGYANTMVPADAGLSLRELVRIALLNIDTFDKVAMDGETEKVGNTTVELSHFKTYRQRFEDGLLQIAVRQGWTEAQCEAVGELKKRCPPDRLYRVRGGFHSATRGLSPLAVIVSYRPGQHGGPPEAGMAVLGFSNDLTGSAARPMSVPAEGLEDVTESARNGTLPELRGG